MRGATDARDKDFYHDYINAMYTAMWVDGKKVDDPEVVIQTLAENSLPAGEIVAGVQEPDVKGALIAATDDVVDRGAFGSPTFFIDKSRRNYGIFKARFCANPKGRFKGVVCE